MNNTATLNLLTLGQKLRWFAMTDSIEFDDNGQAVSPDGGSSINREARYSHAYMLRRSRAFVPSEVEMTIIVYNARNVQLPPTELTFLATGAQGDTTIYVTWDPTVGQNAPELRRGMWILDASPTTDTGGDLLRVNGPLHSYFYRVVGISPVAGTNAFYLEVDTPLRSDMNPGVVVVMDNVIEVFDKGTGWKP